MAEIIYSSSTVGLSDGEIATIGKMRTPLRMVIEHESDALAKKGGARDWLFNVEKSRSFADTIVGQNEFPEFTVTEEGAAATKVSTRETYKKIVENVQFMQQFVITAKMMEDANFGVAADAKRRAENFTRAYYRTMNKACETALANASSASVSYANGTIDLTTGDGKALFATDHVWGAGDKTGTQSNFFKHADAFASAEAFEETLSELASKIRNTKDEIGNPLGYTADTIVLPGNAPAAERLVKKVCGTEQASGNASYVNTQYGGWNVIILPTWQIAGENNEILVMSSEANKNLGGNMFFNRVALTVRDFVDVNTFNYIWTGRCRFGVGFGTYKHILKLTTDGDASATAL
jgi:hypothetical protein